MLDRATASARPDKRILSVAAALQADSADVATASLRGIVLIIFLLDAGLIHGRVHFRVFETWKLQSRILSCQLVNPEPVASELETVALLKFLRRRRAGSGGSRDKAGGTLIDYLPQSPQTSGTDPERAVRLLQSKVKERLCAHTKCLALICRAHLIVLEHQQRRAQNVEGRGTGR
jgi:hypothetical protein